MKDNRRHTYAMPALVMALALACMSATAAYASTGEDAGTTTPPAATGQAAPEEGTETEATETQPPADPEPLTPDGQLTLVDDLTGDAAQGKQFITVVTKDGNYFYLVIDRTGDADNVYFLNLVDEADLMALLEEAGAVATTAPAVTEPEPTTPTPVEPEPVIEPEPEGGFDTGMVLGIVALLALAGGGALLYFKVLRPRKSADTGRVDISELDSFGYGADEGIDDLIADDGYLDGPDGAQTEEPSHKAGDGAETEDGQ
jgi:hypothetical protein